MKMKAMDRGKSCVSLLAKGCKRTITLIEWLFQQKTLLINNMDPSRFSFTSALPYILTHKSYTLTADVWRISSVSKTNSIEHSLLIFTMIVRFCIRCLKVFKGNKELNKSKGEQKKRRICFRVFSLYNLDLKALCLIGNSWLVLQMYVFSVLTCTTISSLKLTCSMLTLYNRNNIL